MWYKHIEIQIYSGFNWTFQTTATTNKMNIKTRKQVTVLQQHHEGALAKSLPSALSWDISRPVIFHIYAVLFRSECILTIAFVWRETGVKWLKLDLQPFCIVLVQSLVVGKGVGFQELLKKNQRVVCDGDSHPDPSSHYILHDTKTHYFTLDSLFTYHI